jgi:epoxyqueuosine reductase
MPNIQLPELTNQIKAWGKQLGFQAIGVSDTQLDAAEQHLHAWLGKQHHGTMQWMAEHGNKRARPAELVPGTLRVITARLDYWPALAREPWSVLHDGNQAYISRYALGRDYHKLLRTRLQKLAEHIAAAIGPFGYRVFCDSAPVLEKALAEKASLGWIGKHTNVIHREHGSYFFLGEIYTDLPLPVDTAASNHCGTCQSCIEVCPTQAIIAPYQVDARRCISYLTIELREAIPVELRPLIGNRIYGCDDCQLICPWNRFAQATAETDFAPRHQLDDASLIDLFAWGEATFLSRTEGSAIRRIGYPCWLRNIAVALGNAPHSAAVMQALHARRDDPSELVREHVQWALLQQQGRASLSRLR